MRRTANAPALLVIAAVIVSCAAQRIRLYPGDPRPAAEIALLTKQWPFAGGPRVFITEVDGETIAQRRDARYELELIPGTHKVEFGFQGKSYSIDNVVVVFDAEPGHVYEARVHSQQMTTGNSFFGGSGTWKGAIIDLTTGSIVGLPQPPKPRTPWPSTTFEPTPAPTPTVD